LIIFTRQAANENKAKSYQKDKNNLTITLNLLFTTDNMCIFIYLNER